MRVNSFSHSLDPEQPVNFSEADGQRINMTGAANAANTP